MRLVFLGPPGAGKGTQAALLSEGNGLLHLSTGDMFRSAIARGTPTGLQAKSFMDKGQLVPDTVVDALVDERLKEDDARPGFLLDGYPRNNTQAQALEKCFADETVRSLLESPAPETADDSHLEPARRYAARIALFERFERSPLSLPNK